MRIIFSFLILSISFSISGQSTTEAIKKAIKSTVTVTALDNSMLPLRFGSGFIIDDEMIVTNVNVIAGCNSAYILTNGEEKKFEVDGFLAIDKTNGLVILKVSGLHGPKLLLGQEIQPEIGGKIVVLSNLKEANEPFLDGIVSGPRKFGIRTVHQISVPISPTGSGCAVLDSSAQVVGVAFAGISYGQYQNFLIPVKHLIKLKNNIGVLKQISTILPVDKPKTPIVMSSNVIDGLEVKNIEVNSKDNLKLPMIFFDFKNGLDVTVSDIRILFIVYDATGKVANYQENIYYKVSDNKNVVEPFRIRGAHFDYDHGGTPPAVLLPKGYKIDVRILDFKIFNEE